MFMLSTIGRKLAAAGAGLLAIFGIFAAVRQSGKRDERNERQVQDLEARDRVREAERLAPRSRDDRLDRLRDGSA